MILCKIHTWHVQGMNSKIQSPKVPRKAGFVGIWHWLKMGRHQKKPIGLILKFQVSAQGRRRPNLGRRRPWTCWIRGVEDVVATTLHEQMSWNGCLVHKRTPCSRTVTPPNFVSFHEVARTKLPYGCWFQGTITLSLRLNSPPPQMVCKGLQANFLQDTMEPMLLFRLHKRDKALGAQGITSNPFQDLN